MGQKKISNLHIVTDIKKIKQRKLALKDGVQVS